ncbi:hypothetical protein AAMO2058_000598100 [Amorphochlora amoebiformis]
MAVAKLEELQRLVGEGEDADFDKIISITKGFLASDEKDLEMLRCQVIANILKEDYWAAVKLIDRYPNHKKSFSFHLLYCYYQLKQNDKAMKIAQGTQDKLKTKGFWHVQAQLYRRVGKSEEASEIYKNHFISKKARMAGESGSEIRANYIACLSDFDPQKATEYGDKLDGKHTYAVAYNLAAPLAACGRIGRAEEMLGKAMELCKEEYKDDKEELEQEMESNHLMKGYLAMLSGNTGDAQKILMKLVESKQDPIRAGAILNLLHISNGSGGDSMDLAKTLGTISTNNLSNQQKKAAEVNQCLMMIKKRSYKDQAAAFEALKRKYPGSEYPPLSFASQLFKDKKGTEQAERVLKQWIQESSNCDECRIALASLYLSQKKSKEGIEALLGLGGNLLNQPGVVGTLVRLYNSLGLISESGKILDNALAYWKSKEEKGVVCSEVNVLKAANAHAKYKLKEYKEAASMYQELANQTGDLQYISGVVASASHYDLSLAEKFAKKLPGLSKADPELDAISIEALPKTAGGTVAAAVTSDAGGDTKMIQKRKKKRKKRLPKNYNPEDTPDPERWLPKWERSYNKRGRGKRNRNKQMRGPQGGAVRADLAEKLDKSAKPDNVEDVKADVKKKPPVAPKKSNRDKRRAKKKKRR